MSAGIVDKAMDLHQVPEEFFGRWLAIDSETKQVFAYGDTLEEVERIAGNSGGDYFLYLLKPCAGGFLL